MSPEIQEAWPVYHFLSLVSGLSSKHLVALRGALQTKLLPDYNTKPQVRDMVTAQ